MLLAFPLPPYNTLVESFSRVKESVPEVNVPFILSWKNQVPMSSDVKFLNQYTCCPLQLSQYVVVTLTHVGATH